MQKSQPSGPALKEDGLMARIIIRWRSKGGKTMKSSAKSVTHWSWPQWSHKTKWTSIRSNSLKCLNSKYHSYYKLTNKRVERKEIEALTVNNSEFSIWFQCLGTLRMFSTPIMCMLNNFMKIINVIEAPKIKNFRIWGMFLFKREWVY